MDELETVATYDSLPMAEFAQLRLQEEGIQAVLINANVVAAYHFLSFAVGGIKLQVPRRDAARAEAILSSAKLEHRGAPDGESLPPIRFSCSDCGAVLEFPGNRRGGVESCDHCGQYVDVPEQSEPDLDIADAYAVKPVVAVEASEPETAPTNRRIPLLIEIPAVLAFVYLPHLFYCLPWFYYDGDSLVPDMARLFVGSVQSAIPLLLVIALSGEGWKKFGIVPFRSFVDCSQAFALWFVHNLSLTFAYIPFAVAVAESVSESDYAIDWPSSLMCLLGLTANSIAEELAMRGYLITRLEELWRSRWLAVVVSAALFASYHAYQGLWGTVAVAIAGVLYGSFFVWQRRLWPLIIAHTIYNLLYYF